MEQMCNAVELSSQIRRSLLGQPRENQLSVAHWLKLLTEQYQPAMELLVNLDKGKIEFGKAMEMLNSHSEQDPCRSHRDSPLGLRPGKAARAEIRGE